MKVIQLGDANDGLCHFLSLGGYEMLLDCGAQLLSTPAVSPAFTSSNPNETIHVRIPELHSIDVESLDLVLVSNHFSILALPILTEQLGFTGEIYATELTLEFGRLLLEELAVVAQDRPMVFHFSSTSLQQSLQAMGSGTTGTGVTRVCPFTLADVRRCCTKITCVEYKEVTQLSYGVKITALSSGLSLGASTWLIESPSDRLAYVPAASGDYNRHPKELDLLPLVDCETLLLTDLKPDRDPHANTERMVERFLSNISRVVERGGICVIPTSPCGIFFDLVEAIYAAFTHMKQMTSMYFISSYAVRVMELTQLGPEWLCEKKIEKLYASDDAFVHESLWKSKMFHLIPDLTPAVVSTFQPGSILFVGHPSLKCGRAPELIRMLGHDSRNAVLFIDPSVDPREALTSFQDLELEKIVCHIDPRLSCGDANQFIARCCPRNLIVPYEYTVDIDTTPADVKSDQITSSHFSRVLPLNELTPAKPKTELLTLPMKLLDPIVLDKTSKYVDGRLDPKLAAQTMLTEVSGKAAACISGVLSMKRKAFVVSSTIPLLSSTSDITSENKLRASQKRKTSSSTSMSPLYDIPTVHRMNYREQSSLLLGQVDEERLMKQIKTHDPQAQVYISQGQGDADVFMSIPVLDARVTLWKEAGKTLIETEKEDSRALLTSFVLAQLVEEPNANSGRRTMERVEVSRSMNVMPSIFQAGISNKFTKRHVDNFHDTTLTAASAAKERAERKMEQQANAIAKQQKKIENEMKKIEEITQRIHRQQLREGKRLRNRLTYAATKIQRCFRRHFNWRKKRQYAAAVNIQQRWRGILARYKYAEMRIEQAEKIANHSARIITRQLRYHLCKQRRALLVYEQYIAASKIQSIVRMVHGQCIARDRRERQHEKALQHRSAIIIQANARAFLTRLIYLDVVYLICRIQAVMRGFLTRKRLRWITESDVDGICKLQALVRGYLLRQRYIRPEEHCTAIIRSGSFNKTSSDLIDHPVAPEKVIGDENITDEPTHIGFHAKMNKSISRKIDQQSPPSKSSVSRWLPVIETIKRSYWLPAGACVKKQLPVLQTKRVAIIDDSEDMETVLKNGEVLPFFHVNTPKKRHQKSRPIRLNPVHTVPNNIGSRLMPDAVKEEHNAAQELEDRMRREEELKAKLLHRKAQEKRKQALELQLKHEHENEANERKLMEREEKSARLLTKVLRRRTKEVISKKHSAEQQQEERERIAMAREERKTKLQLKLEARQLLLKKQQSHVPCKTNKQKPELPSHSFENDASLEHTESTETLRVKEASDNMSFLNIDFKIPSSIHTRKPNTAKNKSKKVPRKNVKGLRGKQSTSEGNQVEHVKMDRSGFGLDVKFNEFFEVEVMDDDGEFDYGNEFEEFVDESKLGRLIC